MKKKTNTTRVYRNDSVPTLTLGISGVDGADKDIDGEVNREQQDDVEHIDEDKDQGDIEDKEDCEEQEGSEPIGEDEDRKESGTKQLLPKRHSNPMAKNSTACS
ncbi:hypothetical protein GQ43DRAFT_496474 [Delitschia confertaspora ATCC 74209]|uniref:Uncharacterized protein n=1 Tax=Delitschia confertaspora ATCC 74209 TaxID=1513339 RepID=A0A9P4N1P4_9PLEO|nr:hypothetical protein GQ43DRAFT_496474 [Delitschia confertaspora ATCC 74209]